MDIEPTNTVYSTLRIELDGPGMWRHLEVFDRHCKEAGSPGERESLAYIEARMREYGYATELILHDAYISLPGPACVVADGAEMACITHAFSRSSAPEGLTAPLVYVGAGDEAAFGQADVRGRIVLVDGIANPVVTRRASLAGAVGQVHVSPHEHKHEMCISAVWGSPSAENVTRLPSTVVVSVAQADGARLKTKLDQAPGFKVTLHAAVDTGWRKTPILIAELPGPDAGPDAPFVLFSGHHDAWYQGTMDNGGANATMMEVARLCAKSRLAWKRGMRVAFWSGHSQGRYSSSAWYADTHWEELERRMLVHVNVDSTGGLGNTVVADTAAAAELRSLAQEAIEAEGGQQFQNRRMGRAGDQSFWGIGVPSMYGNMSEQPATETANASAAVFGGGKRLGHGTGWWWHTPHDRLDKMDEAILVRDTGIYLLTVWRLLTDPVLPLDYAEHARYLLTELKSLQDVAGERFDLGLLLTRAEALAVACDRLNAARAAAGAEQAASLNARLQALSRTLVPLDYTQGDRFDHDPATPQGIYPALQALRRLPGVPAGSDEARFLDITFRRACNRVGVALAQALSIAERE